MVVDWPSAMTCPFAGKGARGQGRGGAHNTTRPAPFKTTEAHQIHQENTGNKTQFRRGRSPGSPAPGAPRPPPPARPGRPRPPRGPPTGAAPTRLRITVTGYPPADARPARRRPRRTPPGRGAAGGGDCPRYAAAAPSGPARAASRAAGSAGPPARRPRGGPGAAGRSRSSRSRSGSDSGSGSAAGGGSAGCAGGGWSSALRRSLSNTTFACTPAGRAAHTAARSGRVAAALDPLLGPAPRAARRGPRSATSRTAASRSRGRGRGRAGRPSGGAADRTFFDGRVVGPPGRAGRRGRTRTPSPSRWSAVRTGLPDLLPPVPPG
jgi:hypothetical protein